MIEAVGKGVMSQGGGGNRLAQRCDSGNGHKYDW